MDALQVLNNRYQLLSVIKRGGFGTIYKGYDSVLGKDIAVKEINEELLGDAWYIDQFQNEARQVARMNHQNIVHIFDLVKSDDGKFYIVMEYIDGLDLSKLLQECRKQNQPIPQHLAIHIVAEICKALDYAHNCTDSENNEPLDLVHQDISPSNIMISKNGTVKLIDFGIAGAQKKFMAEENNLTLQGKIQYMSPEHVSLDQELDKRSDLFSLGLVLYEVLENRRFFQNEDGQDIIDALRNGKLKLKDYKHTPKALQKVVARSLERTPEKRYQNANQVYIDLVTYFVVNADSSTVHTELGNFVAGFSPKSAPKSGASEEEDFEAKLDSAIGSIGDEESMPPSSPDHFDYEPQRDEAEGLKTDTSPLPVTIGTVPESAARDDFEEVEMGDEIKTVIDAVRLAARGHQKLFKRIAISVGIFAVLFLALDVTFRWTSFGESTYDFLFPPAIKIASQPAGAQVHLNGKALAGVTPLTIDEIEPGVHELKLTLDKYNPIIKSIQVPSKGDVRIKGEEARRGNRPYTFNFLTTLELDSRPQGAEVVINDIKYGQKTPCTVTWEVGEPCRIEMTHAGFPELTGFSLDTENMVEEITDHRVWEFAIQETPILSYQVQGIFGKEIEFNSNPANALIYVDDASNPIGRTGDDSKIFLTAGSHEIHLRRQGYNSRTLRIEVNEATPTEMFTTLTRPVRFIAYDATDGRSQDLGATLRKLVRNGATITENRRTPITLNLLPSNYYAIFTRDGYKTTQIDISPTDRQVTAVMEPLLGQISVVVLDEDTNEPLSNVEIRYKSLDNPAMPEKLLAFTDEDGTCSGTLEAGLYMFITQKAGFEYREQSLSIQASDLNLIEFNLSKLQARKQ